MGGQPEIGDEEEGVECISYQDLICENPFEKTGYNLKKACAIFKDLDVSPFNSTIFVPTDTAFENFDALLDDSVSTCPRNRWGKLSCFMGRTKPCCLKIWTVRPKSICGVPNRAANRGPNA